MEQTSQAFDNYIMQDSREFESRLLLSGTPLDSDVKSINLMGGSNSENDFSLGSAMSQYIDAVVSIPTRAIEGREVTWQIGADVEGVMQWVDMGIFIVEKPEANEREIKFTAYDRMMKMGMPYFSNLGDNTNTVAMLNEIGQKTGVTIATTSLNAVSCKKIEGCTYREALSYIAQMHGGFAICGRDGTIYIKTYTDGNYHVEDSRYWDSFDRNEFSYVLQKITCHIGNDEDGKSISLSVGSGAREISFSNPYMTQSMLNNIWMRLKDYIYMPGELKFLGDPRVDPWDILTVVGTDGRQFKVPCMNINQYFDGGLTTEVKAVGKTEAEVESGFKGPSSQKQDRFLAEFALIEHALINKLDVDTANINYAKITALDAMGAKVQYLEGDYGDFKVLVAKDFIATDAKIANLDATYANVKNLLAGNAGIGDLVNIHLTSDNAVIDTLLVKNQIANRITVGDLMAGIIYTNKFQIWSDENGGMKMFGATQQWTDAGGNVRMQAGIDADGVFNYYVLDIDGSIMFDALNGVTTEGIKSPIITDSMVAPEAGIKGSKVLIDEVNQTLDIAFANMKINIADVEAGAIHTATQISQISSSLNNINLQLSAIDEIVVSAFGEDGQYVLQTFVEGGAVDGLSTATIHARLYCQNTEITKTYPPTEYLWRRRSEDATGDAEWNDRGLTGYSITLSGADVEMVATFVCTFIVHDEYELITMDEEKLLDMSGDRLLAISV